MPYRKVTLSTGCFYHIISRGFSEIYCSHDDYLRFISIFSYYRFKNRHLRFSIYNSLPDTEKNREILSISPLNIEILAYCLMPNHFHFLVKQTTDNGISNFMSKTLTSYSQYFNKKHSRRGSVFEGRFKAIPIFDESYLIHLSRYIHLNPYSAGLITDIDDIFSYKYSSLQEYCTQKAVYCNLDFIQSYFKTATSYNQFILDRADYQKRLQEIKNLLLDSSI